MKIDLTNKKGLVVGIANNQSIAYARARAMADMGATLAVTYLNDKTRKYVEPLLNKLNCDIYELLDVFDNTDLENLFAKIEKMWRKLYFFFHFITYTPKDDWDAKGTDCGRDELLDKAIAAPPSIGDLLKIAALWRHCWSAMRPVLLREPSFLSMAVSG